MLRSRLIGFSLALLVALPSAHAASSASASSVPSSEPTRPINIVQQSGIEVRGDFQVGPTRFVIELDPGEEKTIEVQLTSREGEPRSFSVGVEDFSISDDGLDNIQFYGNGSGPFSAYSWVTTGTKNINLRHGERAFVPVKISVPKNAAVGDHYAVVLFTRDMKDPSKPGLNIVARVGALLLITVKGDVIREGSLQQFLVSKPVFWSLPSQFLLQYKNAGTVHLVPRGHIEIRNIFGATVDDIPIQDWYILRNSVRRREIMWQPRFALGYYSATLHIQSFESSPEVQQTVWFWVIPALPVLLALIAIFIVSFIVQAFMSHFEIRRKKE